MLGNSVEYGETAHDNHDLFVIEPQSGRRMRIKQEKVVDDTPRTSFPTLRTEDSCSGSSRKVKVKQEPSSKLAELKKCLELNNAIFALLLAEKEKIEVALEKNLERQATLQKLLDCDKEAKLNDKVPSQIRAISVFAAPYFRDVKRMVPPLNEDAKIKRRNHDVNAYLKPPRPWTKAENKKLLDGVTGFALMSALKPYKIKRDYLKKKLKDQNIIEFEVPIIEKELVSLERKIKNINEKQLNVLLEEVEGKIDWMTISSVNMEGEKTPEDCENMWTNYLNFTVNKEAFTFEENERLKNIVEDNNERDWDTIAKSLKTNRTPIQCFERYQTRLSTNLRRRFWTKEEDQQLAELVEQHKCGKLIPWNKISLLMEGRTRQQIINRYERSLSQVYNRGPWTPEEDAMLIACYHKYGFRWSKMKDFFQRRSTCSLRERYVNSLDPTIKMGCWTKDEDRLLITLIKRYGYGKWSKICKHIPGRTDNMCLVRAGRILEYSVRYHSEHGSGEYDPGVNDPELFAKILKPLAPTKECVYRNMQLKSCRAEAMAKLLTTVKKVVPGFEVEEENLDSLNFSWLSYELLHRISYELHQMLDERAKNEKPFIPHVRYFTKPRLIRKRLYEDSDEEDFQISSPEKQLPNEERKWLESVLTAVFQMMGQVFPAGVRKAGASDTKKYNSREVAEMSLYKAYLYKQFHCLAKCDEDDDIENVIFSGIDFSETLQTVVSFFIQPPVYDGQFIVLSPNMTTLSGMEVVEVTENRLQSMSKYVSHSKNYMDYICERRKSCPKCLQCLYREQQMTSPKVSIEEVTSNMKRDLFIVDDDTMGEAINIESGLLKESSETCFCAYLEESRKSVQLLRQRFMALFLWPALLSATDFSKEQENILQTQEPRTDVHKNYYWRMNGRPLGVRKKKGPGTGKRGRKRKTDGDSVSSTMIQNNDESEPKPSTSKGTDTAGNDNAAAKKVRKRKKPKKEQEYPEALRRSKRLCVRNRTSFSYPEIKHKRAISNGSPEDELMANPTVPNYTSEEHFMAGPASPNDASEEYSMANPASPNDAPEEYSMANPASPNNASEEYSMADYMVLNDATEEYLMPALDIPTLPREYPMQASSPEI